MQKISIHAPVWGATVLLKPWQFEQLFQSTHPCGVRQCHLTLFCKNKVSIDIEYITNSLYFHCFS